MVEHNFMAFPAAMIVVKMDLLDVTASGLVFLLQMIFTVDRSVLKLVS